MAITSFICGIVGFSGLVYSFFAINLLNNYKAILYIDIANELNYNARLLLALLFIPFLLSLLAIIFGFISRSKEKINRFSLVGRILGVIGIIPLITITIPVMTNNVVYFGDKTHISISWRTIYSYTETGTISAITRDKYTAKINLIIGYDPDDPVLSLELSSQQDEIKDLIRIYLNNKNSSELVPENEELLKREIIDILNNKLLGSENIRRILFGELDVIHPY